MKLKQTLVTTLLAFSVLATQSMAKETTQAMKNKMLCDKEHNGRACSDYALYLTMKHLKKGKVAPPYDKIKAEYIMKGYKYGDESQIMAVASYYDLGLHGVKQDKKKAKALRKKACSKKDAVRDECWQYR